jgi:hypothetical protein
MDKQQKPICPKCSSGEVIPVVYGKPTDELVEQWRRGEVELGGCCNRENGPVWHCKACGNCWR